MYCAGLLAGGASPSPRGVASRESDTPTATRYKERVAGVDFGTSWKAGRGELELLALVPALPWRRGLLGSGDRSLAFEQLEVRSGVAELGLRAAARDSAGPSRGESWGPLRKEVALEALAAAGFPALGDVERGGAPVRGERRVAAPDRRPADWWPAEPVFPDPAGGGGSQPPVLHVSAAAARAVDRGHPWILPDAGSDNPARFAAGTLVRVRAGRDRVGLARTEGRGRIAARMWARGVERPRDAESPEARVAAALGRRRALLDPPPGAPLTDAFCLVHGEADGLPGLAIDRLADVVRVLVTGRACEPLLARVEGALVHALGGDPTVLEVIHLRDAPEGRLERVRHVGGKEPSGARHRVHERGLAFWVDAGLAEPARSSPGVGLYLDQRENRARLAARAARGGRWLNLFAHTGAFSVALLAGGAEEVVSVDLSRAYLRWLEDNLAENDLPNSGAAHRAVRGDGRRFLEQLPALERFDGIVVDPPTAAAAGRRFWSAGRDLEPLLERALRHLDADGTLFVSRNERRARQPLSALVQRAAGGAGVMLRSLEDAPPGADFPRLSHFPEGDPFRAVLAQRDSAIAGAGPP